MHLKECTGGGRWRQLRNYKNCPRDSAVGQKRKCFLLLGFVKEVTFEMDLEMMDISSLDGDLGSKREVQAKGMTCIKEHRSGNLVSTDGDPEFDPEDNEFSHRKEGKDKRGGKKREERKCHLMLGMYFFPLPYIAE